MPPSDKPKTINPDELLGYLLRDITRLMTRKFENGDKYNKLTHGQARVLVSVSLYEGITQTELAQHLNIQKIALTRLIDHLEAKSMMERRLDQSDRRVRRLYLTDGAKPTLDKIWDALSEFSEEALSVLPAKRASALISDLVTIRNFLSGQPGEES